MSQAEQTSHALTRHPVMNAAVIVSALGNLVDVYDLVLFSIVRVPSLKALGLSGNQLFDRGILLLNLQMIGMLLGGIFWGVLGDKRGRRSVLFGSIILYSLANLANGWVHSVEAYAVLRLIAGFGLAGELGIGVTLVSEILPRDRRGYGTTLIAAVGVTGAVLAAKVADTFDWRVAYELGGILGLGLLVLRGTVLESEMFESTKKSSVGRGVFLSLFKSRERFLKYLRCVLIGIPVWFVIGILITFAPELAQSLGISGVESAAPAVLMYQMGSVLGNLASGVGSQLLRNRKRVLAGFIGLASLLALVLLTSHGISAERFRYLCLGLGFAGGYWAVFITTACEQFGTNLRATVTTTVPNFVRSSVVPLTLLFKLVRSQVGIIQAGMWVGALAVAGALLALWRMEESYSKDLDYVEPI